MNESYRKGYMDALLVVQGMAAGSLSLAPFVKRIKEHKAQTTKGGRFEIKKVTRTPYPGCKCSYCQSSRASKDTTNPR